MAAREFVDSVGVSWVVWSVMPGEMSSILKRLTRTPERRLPWLVFESSDGERRRLVPAPDGWARCDVFTLERWMMRAERVPPAPARRVADKSVPPERREIS